MIQKRRKLKKKNTDVKQAANGLDANKVFFLKKNCQLSKVFYTHFNFLVSDGRVTSQIQIVKKMFSNSV